MRASLSGAINTQLDWSDDVLRCESMPRPDARGVRLRLSGDVGDERLAIIIALPTLEPGVTGPEFDSVITLTVEDSGRFFSTPNLGTCWTDIETHAAVDDEQQLFNIVGTVTCVGPLGEFNADAFIDIRDLHFSALADWSKS